MKSKMQLLCLSLFCGATLLAGCKTRFVDFTVISTKNVDWSKVGSFERGATRADGSDKAYIIIFVPTGTPNLKEAIDRAIEAVPGAVGLLDGVVHHSAFYFPYVYGEVSYVVEGTPLIDPALRPHAQKGDRTTSYLIASMDDVGQLASLKYVSKPEFDFIKQCTRSAKVPSTN